MPNEILQEAIARLRRYAPPATSWNHFASSRRAAVLILLFADPAGALRVVLTVRSKSLRSYSGQSALPGGKCDDEETAFVTARREASEEIGLPIQDSHLPPPFKIEPLCELPPHLALTELVVRPCVAFLHSHDESTDQDANTADVLIPRVDAKEVAAVFSAPFKNFLFSKDDPSEVNLPGEPSDWYRGFWTEWNSSNWPMHNFYVPTTNQSVILPKREAQASPAANDMLRAERYRVFGMTARILVDTARIAYNQDPQFEHTIWLGDEDMINRLDKIGRLGPLKRPKSTTKRTEDKATANL